MLLEYVQAAMKKAKYKMLPEDKTFFGHIPPCKGVWANAPTAEQCRVELQEVLEDWILIGLWHRHKLPVISGLDLNMRKQRKVA